MRLALLAGIRALPHIWGVTVCRPGAGYTRDCGLAVLLWVVESSSLLVFVLFVVRASVVHACQAPHSWGKVHAHLGCALRFRARGYLYPDCGSFDVAAAWGFGSRPQHPCGRRWARAFVCAFVARPSALPPTACSHWRVGGALSCSLSLLFSRGQSARESLPVAMLCSWMFLRCQLCALRGPARLPPLVEMLWQVRDELGHLDAVVLSTSRRPIFFAR